VGYARRNFLVPLPRVDSFEELNNHLLACCLADDRRCIDRQPMTIGEAWAQEKAHLLLLRIMTLTAASLPGGPQWYSQVESRPTATRCQRTKLTRIWCSSYRSE